MAPTAADVRAFYDEHFDPREVMERQLSSQAPFKADSFICALPYVLKLFPAGAPKGGVFLEMSLAPLAHCAVTVSDRFADTYFACPNAKAMEEVRKWVKNEPGCFNVTDLIKTAIELVGSGLDSLFGVPLGIKNVPVVGSLLGIVTQTVTSVATGVLNQIQGVFQKQVKNVLPCNFMSSNPLDPTVLPPVDCLVLSYFENFAADETSYSDALRNVSPLLKKGGYLMMYACLGATFYKVGDVRLPLFCLKEDFLKKVLMQNSYNILESQILKRKTQDSYDVSDFEGFIILKACKQ